MLGGIAYIIIRRPPRHPRSEDIIRILALYERRRLSPGALEAKGDILDVQVVVRELHDARAVLALGVVWLERTYRKGTKHSHPQ